MFQVLCVASSSQSNFKFFALLQVLKVTSSYFALFKNNPLLFNIIT